MGRGAAGTTWAPEIVGKKDNARMTAGGKTSGRSFIPMTLGHKKCDSKKLSECSTERLMWAQAPSLVGRNHEPRRGHMSHLSGGAKLRYFSLPAKKLSSFARSGRWGHLHVRGSCRTSRSDALTGKLR